LKAAGPARAIRDPVQVTLTGEQNRRLKQDDFLDNRLDVSTARCAAVRSFQQGSFDPAGTIRPRAVIGSAPMSVAAADTAIATDQSRKIVFVVKDDDHRRSKAGHARPLDEGCASFARG